MSAPNVSSIVAMVKRVDSGMDQLALAKKKTERNEENKEKKITSRQILIALICCIVDFGIAQFGLLTLIQKAYSGLAYLAIPVILIPYIIHMIATRFDTKKVKNL